MKQHLKTQLLVLLPLVFIAGLTFAAYDFVAPGCAPTACNSNEPLDVSANDQVKESGLSVNTFNVVGSTFIGGSTYFGGSVSGGNPNTKYSSLYFGTEAKAVPVVVRGDTTLAGSFQSDTLKTGGGLKPLCANASGTLFICP